MNPYVVLMEDRDGAGNRSIGSHFASEGEKDHAMGRQQKKWRARRGCGKDAGWKSQKNDFPTPLGNPANPAGFPLSHSLGDCGRLTKTGHFICYEKGTFLSRNSPSETLGRSFKPRQQLR